MEKLNQRCDGRHASAGVRDLSKSEVEEICLSCCGSHPTARARSYLGRAEQTRPWSGNLDTAPLASRRMTAWFFVDNAICRYEMEGIDATHVPATTR